MTNQKEKEIRAKLDEAKQKDHRSSASDLYAEAAGRDPETGVEQPTEDAVHEAKEWVDQENRM